MDIRKIDSLMPDEAIIQYAAKMIKAGAVVVFPSDTSYGLATNPNDQSAVQRLYKIKDRGEEKPVSCIFKDIEAIEKWTQLDSRQRRILSRNLPGPFTLLLEPNNNYPLKTEAVGVRIPDNSLTKALAHVLDQPYTATSANLYGEPSSYSLDETLQQFEGQIYQPDLILDAGKLPQYPLSAVIDIRGKKPLVIRPGISELR